MTTAHLLVDRRLTLGRIDRRIYGQLLEHVGRAVYGGVFEPGSPRSDVDGFRTDVVDACRALGPTVVRWPGGNFASGYHWRDGVGPPTQRPTRHDLAWDAVETNAFGTEEFLALCRRLGAEPYLALNASTGTLDEALEWVEYCNGTAPLPEVARRRAGPHPEPNDVRLWGIGNENYGWWQHGHTSADRYAEVAREWAKLLRWAEPRAEVVAVGAPDPDWNWTVLRDAVRFIDLLSLHFYWHGGGADPYASTLAGPIASEARLVDTFHLAQAARARERCRHPVRIAVDEWGVWSRTAGPLLDATDPAHGNEIRRQGLSARSAIDTTFEEPYDLKDALAHASWLHVLWRHPEKVGLAAEAQMVNVLAPIHAGPDSVFRHTIFWPLAFAARYAGPVSLDVRVVTDGRVEAPGVAGGELPVLDAGATYDPDSGRLHLSLVNRSRDAAVSVVLDGVGGEAELFQLGDSDPFTGNTVDAPDRVGPRSWTGRVDGKLTLPPASHTTVLLGHNTEGT